MLTLTCSLQSPFQVVCPSLLLFNFLALNSEPPSWLDSTPILFPQSSPSLNQPPGAKRCLKQSHCSHWGGKVGISLCRIIDCDQGEEGDLQVLCEGIPGETDNIWRFRGEIWKMRSSWVLWSPVGRAFQEANIACAKVQWQEESWCTWGSEERASLTRLQRMGLAGPKRWHWGQNK